MRNTNTDRGESIKKTHTEQKHKHANGWLNLINMKSSKRGKEEKERKILKHFMILLKLVGGAKKRSITRCLLHLRTQNKNAEFWGEKWFITEKESGKNLYASRVDNKL